MFKRGRQRRQREQETGARGETHLGRSHPAAVPGAGSYRKRTDVLRIFFFSSFWTADNVDDTTSSA